MPAGQLPSDWRGDHGWLRTHWLPHPLQANSGSPSYDEVVGDQSQRARQGETVNIVLVWRACSRSASRPL